jgi:anti-sigma regulatory factor (Ser/Thr protein kinase)
MGPLACWDESASTGGGPDGKGANRTVTAMTFLGDAPTAHLPADSEDGPTAPPFADWPLQSHLVLGALPSAVPCARLHARQVLWEWSFQALATTGELIVSELVTNSVRASAGLTGSRYAGRWVPGRPPVGLWLHADQHRVAVQVWDGNDQLPVRRPVNIDSESGRGLLLVESLSAGWSAYRPRQSSGKVVWAVLH